jgi:putative DNA primase/helicase
MSDGSVIGPGADSVMLPRDRMADDAGVKYAASGTLGEWQKNVSRYAPGNDLLLLYMSKGFAASLLGILRELSAILHVVVEVVFGGPIPGAINCSCGRGP